MQETNKESHSLSIKKDTTVTGVRQVVRLEEKEVRLSLGDRDLILVGRNFSAERLSIEEGVLVLSGEVETVKYAPKQEVKGLLKRLFK